MDISNLKTGDIVICVDDDHPTDPLTKGKKYEVINTGRAQSGIETYSDYITVYSDNGNKYSYLAGRFISIQDFRDNKLNELGM